MKTIFFFTIVLFLTGCSNRAVYENIQMHERSKCSKVSPSEYRECREATYKPYSEYEREYNDSINK